MSTKKLSDIIDLLAAYTQAINTEPSLQHVKKRLPNVIQPDEWEAFQLQVCATVRSGMAETDDHLQQRLALGEWGIRFMLRIVTLQELIPFVPDDLRNAGVAQTLEAEKAPTLASLCRYQIS